MLHRSFKPAKCKTSLKLAVSRIKLLKNKKDGQVKQMKRELAQLIETGQYRTARIRVEHVVREEKTKAAYELIEIYCELIAARLPMIESQKNCPIDLKEAISSVVFAAPRCADIPELSDVRKHFTTKYGKEFITGAVELRPDCGVGRMLVEKLSTKPPDGPTKMKILAAIAEEHNVKWDPESFEENESKPPEDLLNGPNTYGMASNIHVEPPRGPPPPSHDVKEPPNVQVPTQNDENHVPMNFNEQNARSSPRFQDSASSNVSSSKPTTSGTFHPKVRTSGNGNDRMEMHSFPGDGNDSPLSRQSWSMPFKDATSAAQAAAESAEMASMAARAAAELSRQYVSESRDKSSQSASLASSRPSINNDPFVNSHQMADRYPEKKSSEPEKRDSIGEVSTKRQSSNNDVMYDREMQTGIKPDNLSAFGNMRSEEKSSRLSSRSNSSSGSDDQEDSMRRNDHVSYLGDMRDGEQSIRSSSYSQSRNFSNDHETVSNGPGEDYFVSDANIFESTQEMSSYGNAALTFDDTGSDDDKCKFDVEDYKGQESSFYFSSPDRNPFSPSANLNAWSCKQQTDEVQFNSTSQLRSSSVQHSPVFSENLAGSMDSSQPNDLKPVAFDASDGPSSDSEEELDKSKVSQSTVSKISSGRSLSASHRSLGSSSSEEVNVGSNQNPRLLPTSLNSNSNQVHPERRKGVENSSVLEKKFDYDELSTGQPSPRIMKSGLGSNVEDDFQTPQLPLTMNDSDADNELNYGMLKGGLRNKGLKHPPYTRKPSGNSLPVTQVSEDTQIGQPSYSPTVRTSIVSGTNSREPYNLKGSTRTQVPYVTSDDDSSEEELSHGTVSSRQDLYSQKLGSELKASSRSTFGYFDSEDSEAEEDLLTKISTGNARPSAKLSRRTQPSSNSVGSSSLKRTVVSHVSGTSDYGKGSSRSSYATETLPKPSSPTESSERLRNPEWSRPVEQAAPKPIPESQRSLPVETPKSYSNSSSRSSYATETIPKPSSRTESSGHSRSQEWNRPVERATPTPKPESQRSLPVESPKPYSNSSSRSSYATETLPKPLYQTRSSEKSGSHDRHRPVEQSAPTPEAKRSSPAETSRSYGNSSSRSSYATETLPTPSSQTWSSVRAGSQERHRSVEQADPKPKPEPKRSSTSNVETSKSFSREQSSNLSLNITTARSSEISRSSSSPVETPPKEKASHVHPKLPDADDIFATFAALRQSRQ